MRRYLIYPRNFDTRAVILNMPDTVAEDGNECLVQNNKRLILDGLRVELGDLDFETKLQNFKDVGASPFSIVAHHNDLFRQVRYAFIHGFYYPALTGACALGERILNHLLLDLRGHYPSSSFDKKVHTRDSIADWMKAIETLTEWQVFQHNEVRPAFTELMEWRHKSLHFNAATVSSLRDNALAALHCLANIIERQFGFLESRIIPSTRGAFFLQKAAESDPFIRFYYLAQSPFVTPFYAMRIVNRIQLVFDHKDDSGDVLDDHEFAKIYNERSMDDLVSTQIPWSDNVSVVGLLDEGVRDLQFLPTIASV